MFVTIFAFSEAVLYSLLGFIQGITEALPISSSSHVMLMARWVTFDHSIAAILHGGTFFGLLWHTRWEILTMLRESWFVLCTHPFSVVKTQGFYLGLTALPLVFLPFMPKVCHPSWIMLGCIHILCAGILGLCDTCAPKERTYRNSWWLHLAWGMVQGVAALVPGVSRLGLCICFGRIVGLSRTYAWRWSLCMGLAPSLAACLYEAHYSLAGSIRLLPLLLGMAVAAGTSAITLSYVSSYLLRYGFTSLVLYRLGFGLLLILGKWWGYL